MGTFLPSGTKDDYVALGPTAENTPATAYEHAESERPATQALQPTPIGSGKEKIWSQAPAGTPRTPLTSQWPTMAMTTCFGGGTGHTTTAIATAQGNTYNTSCW